mmetsp:Transcript_14761/g.16814  ORF Transcript_14761/g.16814 Transcript_14761/m.16814 type:complete len:120 (-) Transcript_14761:61-420(-)
MDAIGTERRRRETETEKKRETETKTTATTETKTTALNKTISNYQRDNKHMNMKRQMLPLICFYFSSSHKMIQGRKKEEKNIIQYDGIAPTPQRHTNTLTADRSKAINRRTRTRRQQSMT